MKKMDKKGFTIVELVIVIAVVAILAAILVPVISNLVKRARVTNDTQLVRNLNTALAMDAQTGKHTNMQSALDATAKCGYDVAKINASAMDNMILWDSENDVFCYYQKEDDGTEIITYIPNSISGDPLPAGSYKLWMISDQVSNTYSTYYTGNATSVNVTTGFDAGTCTTLETINYTNTTDTPKSVVIRTNSFDTTLTINAPKDTIKHYDKVGSLNVIAVANASYHENGQVKFVEISTGRIALEAGAEVAHIHINAKEELSEGENAFDKVIISYDKSVDVTEVGFSRDDVEINETKGTLVVALQAGTETPTESTEMDYVWLTKQGIYEQIVVSDNEDKKENIGASQVEWVDTSNKSAETKDAAQKIANNIGVTATVGTQTYDVSVNSDRDIVLKETGTENVVYTVTVEEGKTVVTTTGENPETVEVEVVEAQPDKAIVEAGTTLFAGGTGTQADPFLIEDFDTMQMISFYSNRAYDSRYYSYYSSQSNGAEFVASYEESYGKYNPSYANWDVYYKVKDGVTIIDCSEASRKWKGIYLIGHFDGNGVTFKNLVGAPLFDGINGNGSTPTVIKNFNVDNCLIMTGSYYVGAVVRYCYYDVTFEDISISGYLEANSPASFLGQGNFFDKDCNITFIRCHSSMNLVSLNAQCGGFTGNLFGSYYNANHQCLVSLVDSYFDGSLAVASGTRFSYVECHTATPIKYSISYTNEALENQCSPLYSTGHTEAKDVNYLGSTKTITKGTLSLPETGSVFNVSKTTGAVSAKAYLIVGLNPGNFTAIFVSEEIDLSGVTDSFSTNKVKNYNVVVNDGTHKKTEFIGDTLYIYDSRYESGYGSLTFMVVQYDSLGGIVSVNTKSK